MVKLQCSENVADQFTFDIDIVRDTYISVDSVGKI